MKILFFGDVYGKPGREAVIKSLPRLMRQTKPDFLIANIENISHGKGPLPEHAQEFLDLGFDALTTGNHAWDQKPFQPILSSATRIIRPANYPDHPQFKVPGRGSTVIDSIRTPGLRLGVIQVLGRVFMPPVDCPFKTIDREIEKLEKCGIESFLVDFHAEASSEKQSLGYYMAGRVSAVLGTHCHVQTADERILKEGTAYITDVGMCGVVDSVIGNKKENSVERFLTGRPVKFEPAEGVGGVNAVVLEVDPRSGKAISIKRIREEFSEEVRE